jgi:hypothetical protein
MRTKESLIRFILLPFIYLLFICSVNASKLELKGIVRDSVTNEALPFVSVYFQNTTTGTVTDDSGRFSLKTNEGNNKLIVRMIGYKTKIVSVLPDEKSDYNIYLSPQSYQLIGIVVKPGKEKYTKRNNPAVEFVSRMIANRDAADPKNQDYFSYEHYEKITFALDDFTPEKQKIWDNKNFRFLFDYADTSVISGKPVLNVGLKETLEDVYFQKSPESEKKIVKAAKRDGIDEILPQESVQVLLEEVFREVNIFENDIPLLNNRFVSPLSTLGPSYYKYYLNDTLVVDGDSCVDLQFIPFNEESFGFRGNLYVTLDSAKFVKHARLEVPSEINLNFVKGMIIEQDFKRLPDGTRLLLRDDMITEFKLTSGIPGIYARRLNTYRKPSFLPPENMNIFTNSASVITAEDAFYKNDFYWENNRHNELKAKEDSVKHLMTALRSVPLFYYTEKILFVLFSGYIPVEGENSRFDIGPINTTISINNLEGLRLRAGGMTTAYLHKKLFGSGYVAYGFKDEEIKYRAQLEYSFKEKKEYPTEFPVHSVKASYEYDINQLGQHYLYTNKDNIFLSIKRKSDNWETYLRKAEVSYKQEFYSGFSYDIGFRNTREYATRFVPFLKEEDGMVVSEDSYDMTEIEFKIRFAPKEKFYQTRHNRFPLNRDYPIFTFSHTVGQKGILGSDYSLNRTELGYQQRLWIWIAGYMDVVVKAGKVWDKVPFPMLIIPNTNLSYIIQKESYNLMDAMEFVNDQYVSWDLTYYMNGLLFNRLPLIKKLKWREVISFKGLYGSLSGKNNPQEDGKGLYRFPERTYSMGNKPYMELSAGIENIFKLLRIDYVYRLTYRNHPGVDKHGLRIRIHVNF